jgi:xanthine dehydrogenase accessory factor
MQQDTLKAVLEARARKRPVALVCELASGAQALVYEAEVGGALELGGEAVEAARQALIDDRSRRAGDLFIQVHNPPKRMIVVGAVHIAQPLVEIASVAMFAAV